MLNHLVTPTLPRYVYTEPSLEEDEFPYGWRQVSDTLPNGELTYRQIPLTLADILDPQEGDQMPQNTKHVQLVVELLNLFENRYADDPTVGVFGDLKMRWGIPDLPGPSPDIAIVPNLRNKGAYRSSFDVIAEGTRPCLVIEVVSPQYPGDETKKVQIYRQAGVAEYFIINPHSHKLVPYYELTGYRLVKDQYQRLRPDEQGRLWSQTTGVFLGVDEETQRLSLIDAVTDERFLTASESEAARKRELAARRQAEERAQTAEIRVQAEFQARQYAEARIQAEFQARQDAEARAAELEKRLRELEAELRRTWIQ